MATKHKHYDAIVAWAAGEEIEYQTALGVWKPSCGPPLNEFETFRIKPKRIKKEGWVAVYGGDFTSERIHQTKSECVANCPSAIAYVRIEWEEEA